MCIPLLLRERRTRHASAFSPSCGPCLRRTPPASVATARPQRPLAPRPSQTRAVSLLHLLTTQRGHAPRVETRPVRFPLLLLAKQRGHSPFGVRVLLAQHARGKQRDRPQPGPLPVVSLTDHRSCGMCEVVPLRTGGGFPLRYISCM